MSERAKWWIVTSVIVVLIVVSNIITYELGRRSVLEDIGRSLGSSIGNFATQTARIATSDVERANMEATLFATYDVTPFTPSSP